MAVYVQHLGSYGLPQGLFGGNLPYSTLIEHSTPVFTGGSLKAHTGWQLSPIMDPIPSTVMYSKRGMGVQEHPRNPRFHYGGGVQSYPRSRNRTFGEISAKPRTFGEISAKPRKRKNIKGKLASILYDY